jgi:hypothetical protein
MNLRGRVRRTATVALGATVAVAVWSAGAASLGGATTRTLFAANTALAATVPAVAVCDDFSRAASTGSALDNRPVQTPAACGTSVWTVHTGTWTITGGQLSATTGGATASMNAGQLSESAQTTILNANAGGTVAGIAINHSGATRTFLAAVISGNQLLIVSSNNGTVTTQLSTPITVGASTVLRITRNGSAVTASVDGVAKLSGTLNALGLRTLTGTRTGLYWSGGGTVRFTNILVTSPTAP